MLGLPKTCMHCGVNFMKRNPKDEQEKICNSCQNKENQKKGSQNMSSDNVKIEITIDLNHSEFSKLEELCNNQGMSFSEYFLSLHTLNTNEVCKQKQKSSDVEET